MKKRGDLDFGSLPMLEIDDMQLCQTEAIINYLGAQFGYLPSDLLMRHKGEKICAYFIGDVVMPHIYKGVFMAPKD